MNRKVLSFLVSFLLLLPSFVWTLRDRHVWPWDQAWYAEVSLSLWMVLQRHPTQWISSLISALQTKPPAIAWLGEFFVPLGALLHHVEPALLISVLLPQWGTLFLLYLIGKELFPKSNILPLTGSLFAASMPLFVAMSHQYLVEPLQTFVVAYFYWIALVSFRQPRLCILGHLLIASFLGLLTKFSTPLYCLAPAAIVLWNLSKGFSLESLHPHKNDKKDLFLLASGLLLGILTIAWYQVNFFTMWMQSKRATVAVEALKYGHKDTFIHKFAWWLPTFFSNFSLPEVWWCLTILAAGGFVFFIWQTPTWKIHLPRSRESVLGVYAFGQIFLVLAVFSMIIPDESRYLMPLLPSIVIIFFLLIAKLKNVLINRLMAIIFICQFCLVHAQAQALIPANPRICSWLTPVHQDMKESKLVVQLVELTSNDETANRCNVCGVDLPWLNANSLSFYAAKQQLKTHVRAYYNPLGYGETDSEKAWQRLNENRPLYFISLDEKLIPKDVFNYVAAPILERVSSSKSWVRIPFQSNSGILLFRNTSTPGCAFYK